MKRTLLLLLVLSIGISGIYAQRSQVMDNTIHTLRTVVDNDPLLPAIMPLNGHHHVEISFDELSHEYHRYTYHIEHCNADWSPSQEVFESDYLEGFNDEPIEDYEKSFNTTVLYTHYSFRIPNENVRIKLSGNYRITIHNDEGDEPRPVAEICLRVVDASVQIGATVSSNTDIDFNKKHQQLEWAVHYGNTQIRDPHRELKTVVIQNRRTDNMVYNLRPNIQTPTKIEFTHQRALIFPAGNEYHKFETLDVHTSSLNVDRMEWFTPYHHATLYADRTALHYVYEEDQNGAYIIRNSDDMEVDITSDYILTHFTLESPPLSGGEIYINGAWTHNQFIPRYRMTYNAETNAYEAVVLMKQGYYNYNYLFVKDGEDDGSTERTDGNFHETENEYILLVYHRPIGGRYDRLVGYKRMNFYINK